MNLDLKKILSNFLVIIGIYYSLVGLKVINTKVIWLKSALYATANQILIAGIILAIIGLFMNKKFVRMLKNVFK